MLRGHWGVWLFLYDTVRRVEGLCINLYRPGELLAGFLHLRALPNIGVLGATGATAADGLSAATASFAGVGLEVHETAVCNAGGEALGVQLNGHEGCARPTPSRFWRVRGAVQGLLRRRAVNGLELEIVVGHLTFLGLVRRESLSCFHCVNRFVQRHYFERAALWPIVVEELLAFMGLMSFLHSDWDARWLRGVYRSDASLDGFGLAYSLWDPEDVGRAGRVAERSRHRLGAETARRRAVEAAGLQLLADGAVGRPEERASDIPEEEVARCSLDPDCQRCPPSCSTPHAGARSW